MITVRIFAGLGNTMFQFALYKALDCKHGDVYVDRTYFDSEEVPPHLKYHLDQFNVSFKDADLNAYPKYITNNMGFTHRVLRRAHINIGGMYFEKEAGKYDANVARLRNAYIEGYWQSYKYFEEYEDLIRNEFIYIGGWSEDNILLKRKMTTSNSVCVHVRRGDYLNSPKIYPICSEKYYKEAIKYMKEKINNPMFFVFSNDLIWCREIFNEEENVEYVDVNDIDHSYMDMVLMTQCKYHIISNSTFSWWGAWLANESRIVIAPKKWLHEAEMPDICCKSWIRM